MVKKTVEVTQGVARSAMKQPTCYFLEARYLGSLQNSLHEKRFDSAK
jgi:hypothetical protein